MEMIGVTLVALTLACTACGTLTSVSGRNQYEANEDGPEAASIQLLDEVADNNLNKIQIPHRFNILSNKLTPHKSSVPELQVGCEEGLIKTRKKRANYDNFIERRNYNPWSNNLFRPSMYQINRPYLIPIWGPPGRIPIFFPPQPIPYNPGFPPVNPPNALEPPRMDYMPPNKGYLPPDRTTSKPDETTVNLVNKFGDQPPVWDNGESQAVTPTPSAGRPTRRPRPNRPSSTHPPLLHINNKAGSPNNLSPEIPVVPQRLPTTVRPFVPKQTEPPFTSRPPPQPTRRPPATQQQQPISNCVWAIIQCCSGTTTEYSSRCFEERNCAGAFWDSSPCESDFAKAAIATASQYYLGR